MTSVDIDNGEVQADLPGQKFLDSFMNSKDRLRILERAVESARNGIVITDPSLPDNPIVYANKAFLEMTGYSESEVLGKNCRFLQGLDRQQEEIPELRKTISEGKSSISLLRNYRKDGSLFWNELSIAPVYDANGKVINFIGVQHDVSARKEAERRVSEFYSMVSHELRTPLSSIRASLGLMSDGDAGPLTPQSDRLICIAMSNTERLLKLVDDILDMKKMEAGRLELRFSLIDPDRMVSDVMATLGELAATRKVSLKKQIQSTKSLCADEDRLTQVLTNLIANAIKFSPPSAPVNVVVSHAGAHTFFSVSDKGPGIAEDDISKLFVKFQQLDSSDTRIHAGTGLGLAISKLIVELHGGESGVTSKLGEGSTFWFKVPTVPAVSKQV